MRGLARLVLAALSLAALAPAPLRACPDSACALADGTYRARLPEGAPRGVVLHLHGWGGTAAAALRSGSRIAPMVDRGYAVIAPQGLPRWPGDPGGRWNAQAAPGWRDDVAFLRAVLADARGRFELEGLPTLAAGFSGGGMMIWRLACAAPGTADAYAPVAGLMWRPLPERCAGPARLLHAHGWRDRVVPPEGRAVAGGRLVQGDLWESLALMRRANGCGSDAPDAAEIGKGALWRRVWRCPGAALALALHPGGHDAPPGWADMALDWLEAGGD